MNATPTTTGEAGFDMKRGWRVYKLAQLVIELIRESDAKRVKNTWFGHRVERDLDIYSAIGNPTASGFPSFVAARVDCLGETVLDTVFNESSHKVTTFKPGSWERRLKGLRGRGRTAKCGKRSKRAGD